MNVLVIDHPWNKSWLPLYCDSFHTKGGLVTVWDGKTPGRYPDPDLVFCTWSDRDFTRMFPNSRHVMMMRRFEFFHSPWDTWNWDKIDALVCCNPWIAGAVAKKIGNDNTTVVSVRNTIDPSKWTFKKRGHGKNIGMVCRVHPIKNLPLAAQIMGLLPEDYKLHIAGPIQDPNVVAYMVHSLKDRVIFYGQLEREHLDPWWEDKSYCLSTSISEGDPMCVLEAMAKGIKPIVHDWPGASEMYDTFKTTDQAVAGMGSSYNSGQYLETVKQNNGISNIEYVVNLALCHKTKEKEMEAVKDGLNEKANIKKNEGQGDRSDTTGVPKKPSTEKVSRGGKNLTIR